MLWWILGGPIFVSPEADATCKALLAIFVLYLPVDAVLAFRRATIAAVIRPIRS